MSARNNAVELAEECYDSDEADAFYKSIWGGEDVHIGLYKGDDDTITDASQRTVDVTAERLGDIGHRTRILDLGAGNGAAARFLAEHYGCHVTCLYLSEMQNTLNRKLTAEAGLADCIEVVHWDIESMLEKDDSFDVVWSQDAILRSGNRRRVLDEVRRVLRPRRPVHLHRSHAVA